MTKMRAWDVVQFQNDPMFPGAYRKKIVLDTVFFDQTCDARYVKRALIDRGKFPQNVMIYRHTRFTRYGVPL